MAYGEYYVERQGWAHWPKVLIMCRKRGDGIERHRYLPETELQMVRDELREECKRADMAEMKLRHHMSVLKSVKETNADLCKQLKWWHRLTANIELPEYPVSTFQPKDLERENADLRELVRDMYGTYDQLDLCRLCSDVEACDFGLLGDRCSMRDRYLQRMRELGVVK